MIELSELPLRSIHVNWMGREKVVSSFIIEMVSTSLDFLFDPIFPVLLLL